MSANERSLKHWVAKRKTSVILAITAVLAGMILLNPLLFGLEASPNHSPQKGPTFYSTFTKNSFKITLHLSSYDEQRDQILPAPIEVKVTEIIPVTSRRHCNESEFYDAVNRNPAASRHRITSITRIRPPTILVKFKLPNDYNGQYACFRVVMRDANGESQRHFYASTQKLTATLVFDHDFDQGADASTMISNLKLRSYNGQQSSFWPTQTKISLQSALSTSSNAEATCKSNHNREPARRGRIIPNIQSLQWLQDPGSKRTFRLGRDLSYICYTIWIDGDGDGENWWRYFYAPASPLPRYYGQDTSAAEEEEEEEEEEGLSFNHKFTMYADDLSSHSVYLVLDTYPVNNPPTGRNPLVFNISTPLPVDKPSDCNLDPFADGFVLLAQEAEITSPQSVMAKYYLRDNPQLSGKFACFLLVERENKQDKEVYFYAAFIETFDTADLPENWNLQEALKIFRRQLTAKGQNIAKDIDYRIDRNGCPSLSADNPSAGCWEASSFFGLKGGNIYLNDDLFPDDYAARNHYEKIRIIRRAVDTLTHEILHAIEDDRDDLPGLINSCYRKTDAHIDPLGDFLAWYLSDTAGNRLSYVEQLPSRTEDCLNEDSTWGVITKALREIYENTEDKSALPDIQAGWGRYYGDIELYSIVWYVEFHAELTQSNVDLPTVLEDYYNLYLKNRRNFASTVNNWRYYFDF